jgi:hypothetical protein
MFTTVFDVVADVDELSSFVDFVVFDFLVTTRLDELQLAKKALKIRMRINFFINVRGVMLKNRNYI